MEPPHKYLPLFVAEATEQLELLTREVVLLEGELPGGPLWDSIFRRAHSVKGSAATLGLTAIVDLAHAAEELIGNLKRRPLRPEKAHVDLLLEAADALSSQVQLASRLPIAPPQAAVAVLAARLGEAARSVEGELPPLSPKLAPRPALLPVVDPTLPRLQLEVLLSPRCAAAGARALVLERKLRKLGTLLELLPMPATLQGRKEPPPPLRAVLATRASLEEVRKACLAVPEVESVKVEPLSEPPPAKADPEELRVEPTVRVKADALDAVLDGAGELLLGIARVREAARKLPESHAGWFEAEIDRLRRQARELHGKVMTARMTPFSALTGGLPRAVRDLSHRLGKQIDLEIHGAEVELDRAAIEALADPLSHLIRNAVDHGIELPEGRQAAGKPARGRIALSARRERDRVLVDIEDDGKGLDAAALRARAVQAGVLAESLAAALDAAQSYQLAFLPGVSTRLQASDVSGRGVGLDAVQRAVEALGGKIVLWSEPGRGARFSLQLPLAVSVAQLLLVQVGGEVFGLPMHKVLLTTEYDLSARGGEGFDSRSLVVAGQLVRAYALATLFGLPSLAPPGPKPFLVMEVDAERFALSVDRLVGQEELVMKPLFPPLDRVRGLSAVSILGNGRPLLVLDPRGLYEMALAAGPQPAGAAAAKGAA